eukprot:9868-Heterococcus_DN1.PRE.3
MVLPERKTQRVWTNELEQNSFSDGLQTIQGVDWSTKLSTTTSEPVNVMRSTTTASGSASSGATTRGITTTTDYIPLMTHCTDRCSLILFVTHTTTTTTAYGAVTHCCIHGSCSTGSHTAYSRTNSVSTSSSSSSAFPAPCFYQNWLLRAPFNAGISAFGTVGLQATQQRQQRAPLKREPKRPQLIQAVLRGVTVERCVAVNRAAAHAAACNSTSKRKYEYVELLSEQQQQQPDEGSAKRLRLCVVE